MKSSELFDKIRGTIIGEALLEYVKEVEDKYCDIRQLPKDFDREGVEYFLQVMDKEFKKKLKDSGLKKPIKSTYQ